MKSKAIAPAPEQRFIAGVDDTLQNRVIIAAATTGGGFAGNWYYETLQKKKQEAGEETSKNPVIRTAFIVGGCMAGNYIGQLAIPLIAPMLDVFFPETVAIPDPVV